jgi:tetratricopeptide (TPR) repeat protein
MSLVNAWRFAAPRALAALVLAAPLLSLLPAGAGAQGNAPVQRDAPGQKPSPDPKDRTPPGKGAPSGPGEPKTEAKRPALRMPGASIPSDAAARARLLRDLYAMLAAAEDQDNANTIVNGIEHVWQAGAGDTVRVLIERAAKVAGEERPDLALRLLDAVTRIAPDYPEGFNRRAVVYYSLNEYGRALADLRHALALDPNHFKALEGLGQILRETDQKKAALEVYRRLHAVHPHAQGLKSALDELERSVAGQGT